MVLGGGGGAGHCQSASIVWGARAARTSHHHQASSYTTQEEGITRLALTQALCRLAGRSGWKGQGRAQAFQGLPGARTLEWCWACRGLERPAEPRGREEAKALHLNN